MKKLLMICNGTGKVKNIGDHIQSLAAAQFTNPIDGYVEREMLNYYNSLEIGKMIMNGWFMHQPLNWPPSDMIKPLIVSFHIVPKCESLMFSKKGIEFFKKHAPIGCRDTGTLEMFEKYNIPSFFSGCLTLTLGLTYKNKHKTKKCIFVDPYYEFVRNKNGNYSIKTLLKTIIYGLKNLSNIKKLWKNFNFVGSSLKESFLFKFIRRFLNISAFYRTYSKIFDDSLLFSAQYVTHTINNTVSDLAATKLAEEYVRNYSQASLVVTSRIHCALPCLGIETPVIFVSSENLESAKNPIRSPGRFGGLIDLMRVMYYEDKGLSTNDDELLKLKNKITLDTVILNKNNHVKLSNKLIEICNNFMK